MDETAQHAARLAHTLCGCVSELTQLAARRDTNHVVQAEFADIALAYSRLARLVSLLQSSKEAA